ncbi:DNA-binding protein [Mangrovactinospora gilvigrisea]|uniref:DNA-binding protein n=2 Tax=Mangrovactinospora gilvigrisea TaxID=1428644 RepID=A0A1J7BC37_9ACTN|nr:DNA-binding protein [Mangrovactinospora gilvigrisea]
MPELRVVAVSNDGTRLVLKSADATEYTLPIDERLRAAVRNDRARLGQIEIEVESHLRPRDIQARIRAGASAEEVAQMAGIPVERVRRFEGPVLAERAFMAERARKTPIRRQGESTGPQLGDAVAERLMLRGAEKDSVQWDSWRRDDGTWEVLLVYRAGGQPHSASWSYDPPRRLVQANDEEARELLGESPERPEPSFPFVPRIARLPRGRDRDRERERERDQGPAAQAPAAGTVTDAPPERPAAEPTAAPEPKQRPERPERPAAASETGERDSLTSLLESVPNYRGDLERSEPAASAPPETEPEAAPKPAAAASGGAAVPSVERVERADREMPEQRQQAAGSGAGAAYADILMPRSAVPHRDRLRGTTDRQAEADGVRPGRRATVPSWDEIVFGSRRKKSSE